MDKYINKSGGGERGREEEWAHQVEEVMRWRVGWVCRRGEEEGSGAHHQLCVRVNKECGGGGVRRSRPSLRSVASCCAPVVEKDDLICLKYVFVRRDVYV